MQVSITFDPTKDEKVVREFLDRVFGPAEKTSKARSIKKEEIKIIDVDSIENKPVDVNVDSPTEAIKVITVDGDLIRANTQIAIQKGLRKEVLELLKQFGATTLPALKEEHYDEYNAELTKIIE